LPVLLLSAPGLPPHLLRWLVLAQPNINRVTQEVVGRPRQIGDLGDKFRLDPMHARQDKRRSEARCTRRRDAQRGGFAGERVQAAPQIGEHLNGHARAHAAGVDELSIVGVVAEEQRPKIRPRSFGIRPADDNELLAIERFGPAPEATVTRRIRRVDRLGDHAFETELAGVLEDEFAIACVMTVELEPGPVPHQGLKHDLALDEREVRGVLAVEVQEIESVIDKMHAALAIRSRLGPRKARQSGVVDAAEFAINIGGLHVQVGERRGGDRIFGVQSSPVRVSSCALPLSMRAAIR
jgi:hypothetical protein